MVLSMIKNEVGIDNFRYNTTLTLVIHSGLILKVTPNQIHPDGTTDPQGV